MGIGARWNMRVILLCLVAVFAVRSGSAFDWNANSANNNLTWGGGVAITRYDSGGYGNGGYYKCSNTDTVQDFRVCGFYGILGNNPYNCSGMINFNSRNYNTLIFSVNDSSNFGLFYIDSSSNMVLSKVVSGARTDSGISNEIGRAHV